MLIPTTASVEELLDLRLFTVEDLSSYGMGNGSFEARYWSELTESMHQIMVIGVGPDPGL